MNLKHWWAITYVIGNVNLIVQLAFQIKNWIMTQASGSVKSIARAKRIIVAHVFVRMVSI